MKNFYDILRVSEDATQEQIKDAYIELISKYHPDVYSGDKDYAESYTAVLTEAYSVLKDPKRREEYDLTQNITKPRQSNSDDKNFSNKNYHSDYIYEYQNSHRGVNLDQERSRKYFKGAKRKSKNIFKRLFKSKLFYALLFFFGIEMIIIIFIYLQGQ